MKKRRKKNKNKLALFLILPLLLILLTILLLNAYARDTVLATHSVYIKVNVSDYVGLNLDNDKLHFGTVIKGGTSSRGISLNSDVDGFAYVTSEFDWLSVEKQGIKISPDSDANFFFRIDVPEKAKKQNIEKKIHFYILKKEKEWPLFFLRGRPVKEFSNSNGDASISINIQD